MKKYISALLCAVLILTAAGCSREEQQQTLPPTEPPVVEVPFETQNTEPKYQDVQLEYWSMLAETAPEARALVQAAEVFSRTTGAQVEITWLGGDAEALAAALNGDIRVDLFETSGTALAAEQLPYALDLTAMAEAAAYDSRSYEALRQLVVNRCGYLAGIPQVPYVYGMLYNRDVFADCGIEAAPGSWEEFVSVCQTLRDRGYEPLTMDLEMTYLVTELHMERTVGVSRLAQLVAEGGWENDEAVVESVQRIVDFVAGGYMAKLTPTSYPTGQNKLALSNAAMVVGSNVTCAQVEEASRMDLNWGVFAYPGNGTGTGVFVDSDVLAIHKDCANAQAAFDFAMLLTTGEFDQLRADLAGGIPADPANESRIYGAVELLAGAKPQAPGRIDPAHYEVYAKVWQGHYKLSTYYASTLNILKPKEPSVG